MIEGLPETFVQREEIAPIDGNEGIALESEATRRHFDAIESQIFGDSEPPEPTQDDILNHGLPIA